MPSNDELIPAKPSRPGRSWTRLDDYRGPMDRNRRAVRRRTTLKPRTEPEVPRFTLSILPFIALMVGLAVLSVAVMMLAWPGNHASEPRAVAAVALPAAAGQWTEIILRPKVVVDPHRASSGGPPH